MKRFILLFSFLITVCFSAHSQATITDVKFSTAQVFDVQWYVSGNTLYTSGFNYLYASVNYATQTTSAARLTAAQTADAGSNGRYIAFYNSPTVAGTYALGVFNSDGTLYKVLNYTGSFRALADGAIFYNGNGFWGTLFTTAQGYSLGQSASFTITTNYPTNEQMAAWQPTNTAPLAAGQTAQPAAPTYPSYMTVGSGGTYTPLTYGTSSNITNSQQTKVNTFTTKTINNNGIYIDQVGDNNSITVIQSGNKNLITGIGQQSASLQGNYNTFTIRQGVVGDNNKNEIDLRVIGSYNSVNLNQAVNTTGVTVGSTGGHYQSVDINGSNNSLTTQQTNNSGVGGHYMETTVSGNQNNITAKQTDNGNKIMFTSITGSSNTVDAQQRGTGQHYLDLKMTGNGNSAVVDQYGNTQNKATLDLTNGGGPAKVDIQQSGGQNYNITTTCVTAGGCGTITVRQ